MRTHRRTHRPAPSVLVLAAAGVLALAAPALARAGEAAAAAPAPAAATEAPAATTEAPAAATEAPAAATEAPAAATEAPVVPAIKPSAPAAVRKGACDNWRHPGLSDGPIRIGFFAGDLGTGHRACARSEVALWLRGGAIIDTPDFYGSLGASGMLSGSYAFGPGRRVEVFGTLAFVEFQYVQNASLKGTALSLGPLTLGASYAFALPRDVTLAPYVRLLLPTASLGVPAMGGEVGASLSWHPRTAFELHAVMAADLTFGVGATPAQPRGGKLASIGVIYAPWSWLALGLDLAIHLGQRAPLDYLAPAFALRFRLYRGLGLELAATLPVAGADRHDFLAAFRISYRF
jgi:hypothetical protein